MTPTDVKDADAIGLQTLVKLAVGFALGLAIIPALILMNTPRPDDVSNTAFSEAPREAQIALLNEVAAIDRYDERALVGTSIVAFGFPNPRDSRVAQFGLTYMGIEEATGLIEKLLNRTRPPKTIIVDLAAIHAAPPDYFGVSQTPSVFSLDNLAFSLNLRLSSAAKPDRNANATWEHPPRLIEFREGNFDGHLRKTARFERFSRPREFASALNAMCAGSQTRFVIVRFPNYIGKHRSKVRDFIAREAAIDYDSMLSSGDCLVEFVDLFAESVAGEEGTPALLSSKKHWFDFYHFRPTFGQTLLDDARLGGAKATTSPAS